MFNLENDLEILKYIIDSLNCIIFFIGVGVFVVSGVLDFCLMGGLFDEILKDGFLLEYLLSCDYLEDDFEGFINFCYKCLLFVDMIFNIVYDWIVKLECN